MARIPRLAPGPAAPQAARSVYVEGPVGPRGMPGPRGEKGDPGPQGPKGDPAVPPSPMDIARHVRIPFDDITPLPASGDGHAGTSRAVARADHVHPAQEVTVGGIEDVPGLQDALDALDTEIDGKAAASHTHAISDVTGLQAALDAKASTTALTTAIAGVTRVYDTVADLEAANVDSGIDAVLLAGRATVGDGGGAIYKRSASEPTHEGKVQSSDGAWWALAPQLLTSDHFADIADLLPTAYAVGAPAMVREGETASLPCDPTGGDDVQAMCNWFTSSVIKGGNSTAYVALADGYHEVDTYIDVVGPSLLDVRASATADLIQISAVSISSLGSDLYSATVTVGSALPDRVVAGFAIGIQNAKGDNGAEAINGAHQVLTVAGNRLSFTFEFYALGVAPTSPTSLDNTLTLGLTANQVVVPQACLRMASTGWDGAAREGFMNALSGGRIELWYVGMSFDGTNGEHDILFARDIGSSIYLVDRCVVAGAGDKVLRAAGGAEIRTNRACLGGGTTGEEIYQGVGGSNVYMIRTCMGSVTSQLLTATAGCRVFATQCIGTGTARGLRTTYDDASISFVNGRISHCTYAVQANAGVVTLDTLVEISKNTNPFNLAGGRIFGEPSFNSNTNAAPTPNALSNGGAYNPTKENEFVEEVSFTPSVSFATAGTSSFSYATQQGYYVKVGNLVFVQVSVVFTPTIGTGSGNLQVSLPFTVKAGVNSALAVSSISSTFATWRAGGGSDSWSVAMQAAAGNAHALIRAHKPGASTINLQASDMTNSSQHTLTFSGFYLAD